ncbi:branched-chain amino acid transaminase [Thiotrichales bacterium 19S3-7]|nr:branched-chain amino acid transaminase [Thiotrichales bacterium 19S3-7]MCF6800957.1 branched-chain amino acid transaminase [Thiotrichales bacterium 19S3-11]
MNEMQSIWHNGALVPWKACKVHILTHGLHYGSGIFEGIRAYQTDQGAAVFKLKEHMARFMYSANALGMKLPYTQKELEDAVCLTVQANNLEAGYIRPVAFYGYDELGVVPKVNSPIDVAVACWPWGKYLASDQIDVEISQYIRIHPKSTVADAKICGHYVNSLLSKLASNQQKYHEVLMLDSEGFVAEMSASNIFIVKNNKVYTTEEGTILVGITRNVVMDILRTKGYEVIETKFTPEDIINADEAFVCGTAVEVVSMRSLNDQLINDAQLGEVTAFVKDAYHKIVTGCDARYRDALTLVSEYSIS